MNELRTLGIAEANRLKELIFKKEGKIFRQADRVFTLGYPKDLEERIRELEDIDACIIEFRKTLYAPTPTIPNSLISRKELAEKNLEQTLAVKDYFK